MAKGKRTKEKQRSTKHSTENQRSSNTNRTKNRVNSGAPERLAVPALHVTPVVLLLNGTFENGFVTWFFKHELYKECIFERGSENSFEQM
jgi:hypothetical protein